VAAVLDRNGLRGALHHHQKRFVVMASETGVLDIDPAESGSGRLEPGKMLFIDTRSRPDRQGRRN